MRRSTPLLFRMCGRERSYRIGQSGAAGWSKATKPRRHNLIMIAQELLFVNRLFKLPDLLGIGGSLRMGDSGKCGGGGRKAESLAALGIKSEERSLGSLAGLKPSRFTELTTRGSCPPAGRFIPQADGLDP